MPIVSSCETIMMYAKIMPIQSITNANVNFVHTKLRNAHVVHYTLMHTAINSIVKFHYKIVYHCKIHNILK